MSEVSELQMIGNGWPSKNQASRTCRRNFHVSLKK